VADIKIGIPAGFRSVRVAGIPIGMRGRLRRNPQIIEDAPIETLSREDAEFGLGHIQPTTVFGSIVPFEPPGQLSGFFV
jgi:hypothetical protein